MPAAEMRILVGIPGSGKSTLAEHWRQEKQVDLVLSADKIRKEVTGSMGDISRDAEVWRMFWERLELLLSDTSLRIAVDNTSVTPKSRCKLKTIAEKHGVPVSAHVVNTEFHTACVRNDERDRTVPYDVMVRMQKNFSECSSVEQLTAEGFSEVWVYETECSHADS